MNSFMKLIQLHRDPSINSQCKSTDWFPHDTERRHERVSITIFNQRH